MLAYLSSIDLASRATWALSSPCRIAALAAQARMLCPRMDSPSRFQRKIMWSLSTCRGPRSSDPSWTPCVSVWPALRDTAAHLATGSSGPPGRSRASLSARSRGQISWARALSRSCGTSLTA